MTDPDKSTGRGVIGAEERAEFRKRAEALSGKLARARGEAERPAAGRGAAGAGEDGRRGLAMGQAMRLASELLVGTAVGGVIGWALDRWLGTAPWLMLLLLVIGFAAGMANVVRAARRMQPSSLPGKDLPDDEDDRDRD